MEILGKILENIVKNPESDKFLKLKHSNAKIKEFILGNEECVNLLEVLHFQEKQNVVSESEGLSTTLEMAKSDAIGN